MKTDWIASFIEGFKSVVNVTGLVKGVVSSSIAEGIQSGYARIAPSLVRLALISALLLVGLFMFALGLSIALENMIHAPGFGYLITGIIFVVMGALFYAFNR